MIYCFLLFNIMFENNVLSLVIGEIRFKLFFIIWDILVNKFILVVELLSMKTFILSSIILCFCNTLLCLKRGEKSNKSIVTCVTIPYFL